MHNTMKRTIGLLIAGALAPICAAQTPAVNQADTARQQRETLRLLDDVVPGKTMPSLYSDEESDIGPQSVLRKLRHRWFRGSYDGQVFYTDNVLYRDADKRDGGVIVNTVEAALTTPPLITGLASYRAEAGYRHQFFNYFGPEGIDNLDFNGSTVFADILAQTKHYQFRVGADYTRLLGYEPRVVDDWEEFYSEFVPRWSVQRNLRVCDRSMLSFGYLGSYHFSDEDAVPLSLFPPVSGFEDRNERWEHAAVAAYSVALPHDFVVQPYYRFQFTDFVVREKSEFLHTAGLSVGWFPCEYFSARLFANYNWNDSDLRARDYEQFNGGGGVNLTFRF